MRTVHPLLISTLLAACAPGARTDVGGETGDTGTVRTGEDCGNGLVEPWEDCDDGAANSDVDADACRTDCTLARCGDAVVDTEERCDDGNTLGGDGCGPTCTPENVPGEVEPNDIPFQATPVQPGQPVAGGLTEGDVDCWAVALADNAWVDARVTGPDGSCPPDAVLRLYDPDGDDVADAYPSDTDCARIDPKEEEDATFVEAGTWTVCVEGLFLSEVPAYRLTIESGDDSCLNDAFDPQPEDDPDGDGLANACDSDDDGDGVPDTSDNCPFAPNGGLVSGFDTEDDGWIRQWLLAGPVTGRDAGEDGSCDPSAAPLDEDGDDGLLAPTLGTPWGDGNTWRAHVMSSGSSRIDFTKILSGSTPREVYAFAWVNVPTARDMVVAMGADDGSDVWFDGTLLGSDPTCHGVVADQFQYPVTVDAGWHRLLVKVRDTGGGWGLTARLKDPATGDAYTDLEISFTDATWFDDQADGDGDDLGDACDPTP